MASIESVSYPIRTLAPREVLITQGESGGDLFVLEEGELTVERDGVPIATISRPNSLVGEMSVVLGKPTSATVRANGEARVRVISDARRQLSQDPELTFRIAWLMASRLDATSGVLVEHTKKHGGSKPEQDLLHRLLSALHLPVDESGYATVTRQDMFGAPGDVFRD